MERRNTLGSRAKQVGIKLKRVLANYTTRRETSPSQEEAGKFRQFHTRCIPWQRCWYHCRALPRDGRGGIQQESIKPELYTHLIQAKPTTKSEVVARNCRRDRLHLLFWLDWNLNIATPRCNLPPHEPGIGFDRHHPICWRRSAIAHELAVAVSVIVLKPRHKV